MTRKETPDVLGELLAGPRVDADSPRSASSTNSAAEAGTRQSLGW